MQAIINSFQWVVLLQFVQSVYRPAVVHEVNMKLETFPFNLAQQSCEMINKRMNTWSEAVNIKVK
ncbi:unnamed protein product [Haemonchus placei]|uniref:Uncharacterized protein n=1 Tax=Haemonchus placei TaxID=6290 RepID=A0A3P7WF05_HAEPC|nr:unnamed protein product [Haemonchus placei]